LFSFFNRIDLLKWIQYHSTITKKRVTYSLGALICYFLTFSVGCDLSILKCCTNNIQIFLISPLLYVFLYYLIMNYGWGIVNYGWCSFDWVTLQGKTPRMWYFSVLEIVLVCLSY
jgi:hypothetical protein